uniref:glycosyltransferase family 4 protein n=1 Tax=Lactococcus sp. TaxID=44273 RepID=UPI00324291E1
MKKINFILGSNANIPVGGYKIVFQYANELVKLNYDVSISFMYNLEQNKIKYFLKKLLKPIVIKMGSSHKKQITWFDLDSKIKIYFDVSTYNSIPDADFVIATASQTSKFVSKLSSRKGEKYYFIQSYEDWVFEGHKGKVEDTYCLGLNNIVISKELSSIVEKASGVKPHYLPNFYDHNEFYIANPIKNRVNKVALLNHEQSTKRTKFGLEILFEVKKSIPDLEIELFGSYPIKEKYPEYVHFTYKATSNQLLHEIFGRSKIYLLPSVLEGWGLTGMEAMACGAVLVSSEIGGIVEYANKNNSILIEPKRKNDFVEVIINLLRDVKKCETIAERGNEEIQKFSIENSIKMLENILGLNH